MEYGYLISQLEKKPRKIVIGTLRNYRTQLLSGLIYVADRLNTLFSDSEIKSRVVVLCRTDVLDKLSDPNKTKYIIDSGLMLNWYQSESERIEDNNLCKLVNRRASASLKREVDVFNVDSAPLF